MLSSKRTPNRLINEKSPYLLQHAYNPVDWYPWSDEAFNKAKAEDKPIFLSIGYSTCHWCHVMERESFEDEEVAEMLSMHFISIKVDREERPDVDHIYMTFCQMLTGHGGWPLTILMTPDQKPFYAGTYFPKRRRMGMPGLLDLLDEAADAWNNRRDELIRSGERILEGILPHFTGGGGGEIEIDRGALDSAYQSLLRSFEPRYGGFSHAPKFPTPHNLSFLLRYWKLTAENRALEMVEKTLDGMHRGGVFDHIGFGFSRYSTDSQWLIPHFEKMLYDNALLAMAYLEAYQVTEKEEYGQVARNIFTYILRDMVSEEGGFYSAEDADSEGVEGKFYVWTPDEIVEILGREEGGQFCSYYGIDAKGNFEGKSIPNRIHASDQPVHPDAHMDALRQKVFEVREKRVHPHKDDKILTSWNGLMIAALAMGGRIMDQPVYIRAAEKAVEFIFGKLVRNDGRLLARYREGEAAYPAYAEDYAYLVWGLIELYQATYRPWFLHKAIQMNEEMLKHFWDEENGGLFIYGRDSEQLIVRPKEVYDGALPSGNSVAASNLIRLARLTGDQRLEDYAHRQFKAFSKTVSQIPAGHTHFLMAVMFASYPGREVVITAESKSPEAREMINIIHRMFLPNSVSHFYSQDEDGAELVKIVPFLEGQKPVEGKAAAYICENFACQAPVTDIGEFRQMLQH